VSLTTSKREIQRGQALLKSLSATRDVPAWDPGTLDGVWGKKSQAAWDAFTDWVLEQPDYKAAALPDPDYVGTGEKVPLPLDFLEAVPVSLGVLHWALYFAGIAPEQGTTLEQASAMMDTFVSYYGGTLSQVLTPINVPGSAGVKKTPGASTSSTTTGLLVAGGLAVAGLGIWALTRSRRGP